VNGKEGCRVLKDIIDRQKDALMEMDIFYALNW
jgi:hypothetical protein